MRLREKRAKKQGDKYVHIQTLQYTCVHVYVHMKIKPQCVVTKEHVDTGAHIHCTCLESTYSKY